MNATLRRIHRYLSLTFIVFWLLQSLTGLMMVFRWELDDATISAPSRPLDADALGARISALGVDPDHQPFFVYASGGDPDRYDIYLRNAAGDTDIVRVDGAGTVLRSRPFDYDFVQAGFIVTAAFLHQTLLAGDTGKLLIAFSGILLLTNIVLGLKLAWPKLGQWRAALFPRLAQPRAAALFSWHRAAGLWLAAPALILVSCGALLALEHQLEGWLSQDAPPLELATALNPAGAAIAPEIAIRTALRRYPGSVFAGMRLPGGDQPWYRVRVLQPGESRRVYGTTVVYVSAANATILWTQDAFTAPAARRFLDLIYPIHTGEFAGLAGRLISLVISLWLLTILTLGLSLWWARKRR